MADMKMIIDGDTVEAASGQRTDVIDPATEQVVGSVPKGGVPTSTGRWWPRAAPTRVGRI